jgi:hypothetical protein
MLQRWIADLPVIMDQHSSRGGGGGGGGGGLAVARCPSYRVHTAGGVAAHQLAGSLAP